MTPSATLQGCHTPQCPNTCTSIAQPLLGCQQHAALTLTIQWIFMHCKREISLSLFSTHTYDESITASFTNRIWPDHPTQRHNTMDNSSKCDDSTYLLVLPATNSVPMSRLHITSMLWCHHIWFCPLPKAYLPHICIYSTPAATIVYQHHYQYHIQSTRYPPHAYTVQTTTYHISMTSWQHCVSQSLTTSKIFCDHPKHELKQCGSRVLCKWSLVITL